MLEALCRISLVHLSSAIMLSRLSPSFSVVLLPGFALVSTSTCSTQWRFSGLTGSRCLPDLGGGTLARTPWFRPDALGAS